MAKAERKIPPVHPGKLLRTEFMEPMGLSQNELARRLNVDPRRVNGIVNEKRAITADTALRLSKLFGTTPGFWMNLQKRYELDVAEDKLHDALRDVHPLKEPA